MHSWDSMPMWKLCKWLPTLITRTWIHFCGGYVRVYLVWRVGKWFSSVFAWKWFICCMNVHVCPQACMLAEPRPTTCTQKRLSSSMDAIMCLQIAMWGRSEWFCTVSTYMDCFSLYELWLINVYACLSQGWMISYTILWISNNFLSCTWKLWMCLCSRRDKRLPTIITWICNNMLASLVVQNSIPVFFCGHSPVVLEVLVCAWHVALSLIQSLPKWCLPMMHLHGRTL